MLNGIDSVAATANFAAGQTLVAAPASVPPQWLIEAVERAAYNAAVVTSGRGPAGDEGVVRPGEAIAAEGQVEFGQSGVDTSMMTGEPVPADARAGAAAGSSLELTEPQQQVAS
jgi:cation transport ATPase